MARSAEAGASGAGAGRGAAGTGAAIAGGAGEVVTASLRAKRSNPGSLSLHAGRGRRERRGRRPTPLMKLDAAHLRATRHAMQHSAVLNVMIKAAQRAGRGLKRDLGEVEHLQVSLKGPRNFVTAADRRAEETVRRGARQGAAGLRLPRRGRRRAAGHRQEPPLDRRSARRHHQFPARHSAFRGVDRARARRRHRRRRGL